VNEKIEEIFADFNTPVSFLRYDGKKTTYVTYEQIYIDNSFSGDNELLGYVDYYDFDIYSKGNYIDLIEEIKAKLIENGFTWQPSKSSGDMYEDDTGYFHKTLCFAIEREEE
jgi:hypothetical protein